MLSRPKSSRGDHPRPEGDPELILGLAELQKVVPSTITAHDLMKVRAARAPARPAFAARCRDLGLEWLDTEASGDDGVPIELTMVRRPGAERGPVVYFIHGGGMFMGDRFSGASLLLDLVAELGVVGVTVEYRLAPEFPDPVPREDCYTGLAWIAEHGEAMGLDPTRILLLGRSAGGALAGGLAHRWGDERRPGVLGQMLIYPMLDDRTTSISCEQFAGVGLWDRTSNETGWTALLGSRRGGSEVSAYTAPARSTSLGGLPATFLDVGTNDVLRDEIVDYATRLCQAGVVTELHMWPGACHGFEEVAPGSRSARLAREVRIQWVARQLTGIESH
jgi:acetyl esterase/lipase